MDSKLQFYWLYGPEWTIGFFSTLEKAIAAAQNDEAEYGPGDSLEFERHDNRTWCAGEYEIQHITQLDVVDY